MGHIGKFCVKSWVSPHSGPYKDKSETESPIVVKFADYGDSGRIWKLGATVILGRIGAFGMMAPERLRRPIRIADLTYDGRSGLICTAQIAEVPIGGGLDRFPEICIGEAKNPSTAFLVVAQLPHWQELSIG